MDPSAGHLPTPRRDLHWSPVWARVFAWILMVLAALGVIRGALFIVQGFGPETLAAVGFIVGPLLFLLAIAVALPAGMFLRKGGKFFFFFAFGLTGAVLLFVASSAL